MNKNDVTITCIACPNGCDIKVSFDKDGNIEKLDGYKCKNGIAYAKSEVTSPERILTSSVAVKNGEFVLASVKTSKPIPKKLLRDAVKEIAKVKINAPVSVGDVVMQNILETGVDVVATCNVKEKFN